MAIQLTPSGPRIAKDEAWFAKKEEFARRHCVVLEDFVASSLLERVPGWLATSQYVHWADPTGTSELVMRGDQPLAGAFDILLNQPRLFEAIAEFAGIEEEMGCFEGRCYKRRPIDYFEYWHDDARASRKLGLSISLSPKPVQGGVFSIRSAGTREVLRRVPPRPLGDAHLFRIGGSLEHRVSPVRGTEPKYAFSGWFYRGETPTAPMRHAFCTVA